jgi:hypothetical protein
MSPTPGVGLPAPIPAGDAAITAAKAGQAGQIWHTQHARHSHTGRGHSLARATGNDCGCCCGTDWSTRDLIGPRETPAACTGQPTWEEAPILHGPRRTRPAETRPALISPDRVHDVGRHAYLCENARGRNGVLHSQRAGLLHGRCLDVCAQFSRDVLNPQAISARPDSRIHDGAERLAAEVAHFHCKSRRPACARGAASGAAEQQRASSTGAATDRPCSCWVKQ